MSISHISKPLLIVAAAAAVSTGVGLYAMHEQRRPPLLEVYVFALKSGRSMFIRTPDDQRILVDGGSNSEVIRHITEILPYYSRRIDTLIITQTDDKNVTGLIDLIERYSVRNVYVPEFTLESLGLISGQNSAYTVFLEEAKHMNIPLEEISAGDRLILSLTDQAEKVVVAEVFFPVLPEEFQYSKASAPEVLLNISHGSNSIIFMGSASTKVQKFVSANFALPVQTDTSVLIVSHSALATNMAHQLIDLIRPKFLVYSQLVQKTSGSKSGSSKASNQKISDPLATILIADRFNIKEKGTVTIVSDGKTMQMKNPDQSGFLQRI